MEDLIEKAHAYLDDKGVKTMWQQYTAFEIERMLADFAQQQLKLLLTPDVSNIHICACGKPHVVHICKNCSGHIKYH